MHLKEMVINAVKGLIRRSRRFYPTVKERFQFHKYLRKQPFLSGKTKFEGFNEAFTPRKKIYRLHLERIANHFLNPLTRNIDIQDTRIRQSTKLKRCNDRAFQVQNFLNGETINYTTNRLNYEKLSF